MKMDLIDRSLLQFIQEDSRITVNELSKKLLLSPLGIRKRLQRLEKKWYNTRFYGNSLA